MKWQKLISNKRLGQKLKHTERHDDRSEFKRDYGRFIFSAPFRRMQNKTQVFPLPGSIFVHNHLTHSLEAASVGMPPGSNVAAQLCEKHPKLRGTTFEQIGAIVSTACLAHDMGNLPFGYSGEKAIQTFFIEDAGTYLQERVGERFWDDITHFEGNANVFRLLTHRFNGRRIGGFVMTYSTLANIVKYPFTSSLAGSHRKSGFFSPEEDTYVKVAEELEINKLSKPHQSLRYTRHPLVYLIEAADNICYEIMDIEDAHKLEILSCEETEYLLMNFFAPEIQDHIQQHIKDEGVTDNNGKVVHMRASAMSKLVNECVEAFVTNEEAILDGALQGSLVDHISELQRKAYRQRAELSYEHICHSKPVLDVELASYKIVQTLMQMLIKTVVNPDRFYSQQLMWRFSSQYNVQSPDLETRIMAVIDYISGMTDVYASDIYQKINGISLPVI